MNVFSPPLRSKTDDKTIYAAASGSTSHLAMNTESTKHTSDVSVRLLLGYKMRSRSSNPSIFHTTVPPFKTLAASPMCAAPFPKTRKRTNMRSFRRRSKNLTKRMHGLSASPSHYVDKSGQMLHHYSAYERFWRLLHASVRQRWRSIKPPFRCLAAYFLSFTFRGCCPKLRTDSRMISSFSSQKSIHLVLMAVSCSSKALLKSISRLLYATLRCPPSTRNE